jgi:hypothetical protein
MITSSTSTNQKWQSITLNIRTFYINFIRRLMLISTLLLITSVQAKEEFKQPTDSRLQG